MIGCTIRLKRKRREDSEAKWVGNLLRSKFFESCVDHKELRKNEKNVFCIDCNICFCKHCIILSSSSSSHNHCFRFHRRLQICKYVYHDVVRLLDVQKYLDCSLIQTYKINGEKAVHLNPRPQSRDAKMCKSKSTTACEACGRHIQDFPNRFCSIACKVSLAGVISYPISIYGHFSSKENFNFERNSNESESTVTFAESLEEETQANRVNVCSMLKAKKKDLNKRKGVPQRAPLH